MLYCFNVKLCFIKILLWGRLILYFFDKKIEGWSGFYKYICSIVLNRENMKFEDIMKFIYMW